MKFVLLLSAVALAGYVAGEKCSNVSDCHDTNCVTTQTHVHVECVEKHCTCSFDLTPCLVQADCNKGACVESHGDRAQFHCVDGSCRCLKV